MEVNENILHQPSLLQEKVKERWGKHDAVHVPFRGQLTILNVLFPPSPPLKATLQLYCPNLKKVKA